MPRPPPTAPGAVPHYVVGPAYQVGGHWYYPREDFRLDATGLAAVLPDRTGRTADNEAFDNLAMAAAHPTLQLPAIARVTNLQTGLQVLVRVNDRGPGNPARLIGLTRRAAERLGLLPGAVGRVRIQVEDEASQALRDALPGRSPGAQVASAPRGSVSAEVLAPPPGVGQSARGRSAPGATTASAVPASAPPPPDRLPDTAVQVPADPGQLWIRAGEFGQRRYAEQVGAKLDRQAVAIERVRQGRSDLFRVRTGPYPDSAAADLALDQALQAGVTDARIVVE